MTDLTGESPAEATAPRTHEEQLLAHLEAVEEKCPVCRYMLRGLTTVRCPECGTQLRLRVHSPDVVSRFWITCLVSTLVPTGFHTLLLGFILIYGAIDMGLSEALDALRRFGAFYHVMTCVFLVTTILVFVLRRRLVGLPPDTQRGLSVFVVCSVVLIELLVISIMM